MNPRASPGPLFRGKPRGMDPGRFKIQGPTLPLFIDKEISIGGHTSSWRPAARITPSLPSPLEGGGKRNEPFQPLKPPIPMSPYIRSVPEIDGQKVISGDGRMVEMSHMWMRCEPCSPEKPWGLSLQRSLLSVPDPPIQRLPPHTNVAKEILKNSFARREHTPGKNELDFSYPFHTVLTPFSYPSHTPLTAFLI